ncbi:MAG: hypothetical protein ACLU37_09300 [Collinsella sp.]
MALANRLTRAVFAFTALFAILIGNLTYVQVIKARITRTCRPTTTPSPAPSTSSVAPSSRPTA